MKISQALRIGPDTRMAFVGAGGKTTAMLRSARQFHGKVLVTSTTHFACEEAGLADHHFLVQQAGDLDQMEPLLVDGINLITAPEVPANRLGGLSDSLINGSRRLADRLNVPLLIEADGSRRHPLKAPASHEPHIPDWVNTVVAVAGLSAIGKPLNESCVFHPEIFSDLSGKPLNCLITLDDVCNVCLHPLGGLKNIPEGAEKILLFNQKDISTVGVTEIERKWKKLQEKWNSVLLSTMADEDNEVKNRLEKVAGIILAAGRSERFGIPKQLLDWKGKPFIQHIVETALQAGLDPIVVVLGAVVEPIMQRLQAHPSIIYANNEEWLTGQAGSISRGVKEIASQCGAAVFLMSDMPQISTDILKSYLEYMKINDFLILAPRVKGQPTNPVMFDKRCFPALMNLRGEIGGRQLFEHYPVTWVDLTDPFLALDVDTREDYQALLSHKDVREDSDG